MFNPKQFAITDRKEILSFLERYNFGELISQVDGQLTASHLPFLSDGEGQRLYCHLARANPQWPQLEGQRALVTLWGPHDYISPTWYENPGVPTWNYQVLHVYGHCRVFEKPAEISGLVDRLAAKHEADSAEPWQPDYGEAMLKAIVGVEIEIDELQCKYKLSQNRPAADHLPVIEQLERRGAGELAAAMRKALDLAPEQQPGSEQVP